MRFLKSVSCILFLLNTLSLRAQDSDTFDLSDLQETIRVDTSAMVAKRDSAFVFDSITSESIAPVVMRRVPDSVLQRLRADEAFWYANANLHKKTERPEPRKLSGIEKLIAQDWFHNLLWAVIIGGFVLVLVLFLLKSNIRLFHRAPATIATGNEAILDQDIFSIDYKNEIAKAAQSGNYRLAVRLHFLQTLKLLADSGAIQYKDDFTDSDYLLQLRPTTHYAAFKNLTRYFEYTWYGQFRITPAIFTAIETDFNSFKGDMGI